MPLTPPKTLVMTLDSVGGVWRYSLDLGEELAARAFRVILAGFGPQPSLAQSREAEAAGLELAWLDAPLDWAGEGEAGLRRGGSLLSSLLAEVGADVLHLNTPPLAPFIERKLPCVAAAHSCLATWWQAVRGGPLPEAWRPHANRMAQGLAAVEVVTAPTAAFAAQLRQAYGPLAQLRIVPNAGLPLKPGPKEAYVLAAGRWWDEAKNLAALDAAAAGMAWPLLAAGPLQGPGAAAAEPKHLRYLGSLDKTAMAARFSAAPIFVSPARYEPFGLAVLEAAGAGAALVLSDIPTFRELWSDCALFVDPSRPDELASRVNELVRDEELRRRLAGKARRRASDFTPARQAEALLAAYGEAAHASLQPA